jgi:hypothetical protein
VGPRSGLRQSTSYDSEILRTINVCTQYALFHSHHSPCTNSFALFRNYLLSLFRFPFLMILLNVSSSFNYLYSYTSLPFQTIFPFSDASSLSTYLYCILQLHSVTSSSFFALIKVKVKGKVVPVLF